MNKEQKTGKLFRPTAPPDLFGAFGDGRYGPSTMTVLPTQVPPLSLFPLSLSVSLSTLLSVACLTQEMVVSWNHAVWGSWNVSKENEAFGLLMDAIITPQSDSRSPQIRSKPPLARRPRSFTECGDRLCKDGEPFTIIGGSLHFWRSHPAEWPRRLQLLRQAGFNTVSTYVLSTISILLGVRKTVR